jgi:DNA gyrase subunit A
MATLKGVVKKTDIQEFQNIRSNGLIAIKLADNDKLVWVRPTDGKQHILIITKLAKSIHFSEEDIRDTGRSSQGVRGIRLKKDDEVISMDIVRPKENLILTISENGFGKVSDISHYTIQKRGGGGLFAAKINSKTGPLVIGRILDHPQKELMIVSKNGQAIKIPTNDLPVRGRQTSGVMLIRLRNDDKVTAVAIV